MLGLQFIEDGLGFPSPMVEGGYFGGGEPRRIRHRGEDDKFGLACGIAEPSRVEGGDERGLERRRRGLGDEVGAKQDVGWQQDLVERDERVPQGLAGDLEALVHEAVDLALEREARTVLMARRSINGAFGELAGR